MHCQDMYAVWVQPGLVHVNWHSVCRMAWQCGSECTAQVLDAVQSLLNQGQVKLQHVADEVHVALLDAAEQEEHIKCVSSCASLQ
jgi:hypothetical protein